MADPVKDQLDRFLPLVYRELHRLARQHLSQERPNHSLSPTALINEAYIELSVSRAGWQNHEHFLGIAALTMRRLLRAHARRRKAAKRDGLKIVLSGDEASTTWDYDDLDSALDKLEAEAPELSRVAVCRFFGGMSVEQAAVYLTVSPATGEAAMVAGTRVAAAGDDGARMNPDFDRLAEIIERAEDLPALDRQRYLDENCPPEWRLEVESLLRAGDKGRDAFEHKASALGEILTAFRGQQLAGQTVGTYVLDELLGAGGMGVVYRAHHRETGAPAALKVIPAQFGDPAWQTRFTQETDALRAIEHPGVVRLLESGKDEIYGYLAMELLCGRTLQTLPADDWPSTVALARQVASALAAVHSAGLLHSDLKPENVMIEASGRAVLIDFGLARKDRRLDRSVAGISGTISYLSPEQIRGERGTDRSDVFALGCILYERLAGKRAFQAPSPLATAAAILHSPPPGLPGSVPVPLDRLVRRCLEKDPARRPSAAQVDWELTRIAAVSQPKTLRRQRWIRTAAATAALFAVIAAGTAGWVSVAPGPLYRRPLLTPGMQVFEPALAWNGEMLAFTSPGAGGLRNVWITPPDRWQPRQVTFHPAGVREPALSPTGTQLAFVSGRDPAGIYVRDLATGAERFLVPRGLAPRYSPDGRWIAYWTGRDAPADPLRVREPRVFIIPAHGGHPIPLGAGRQPVWAPDSSRVVFDSRGYLRVWALPAQKASDLLIPARMALGWRNSSARDEILFLDDRSRLMSLLLPGILTPLTDSQQDVTRLALDGTGRTILAEESTTDGLWSLALGQPGGELVPVRRGEEGGYSRPNISADGNTLTYWVGRQRKALNLLSGKLERLPDADTSAAVVWDASENGGVLSHCQSPEKRSCIVRTDASRRRIEFAHPRLHLYLASFSPDSREILFTGEADDAPPRMFIAPASGAPPERWQELGPANYPRWSPDGRIFFLGKNARGLATLFSLTRGETPRELHEFAAPSPSPRLLKPGFFRIAAARDRLVMPLGEQAGRFYRAEHLSSRFVSPFSLESPVYQTGASLMSKLKSTGSLLGLLTLLGATNPVAAAPVSLQNATATFTQTTGLPPGPVSPAAMINGSFASDEGWAIFDGSGTSAQTAVFETATDQGFAGGSLLTFTISQLYTFGANATEHSLGRFRISVTTDDRSLFADGLATGGDVMANWIVLTPTSASGTNGPTLTVLGDGSVLVSGTSPSTTVYTIAATTALQGITGIRLEALADASLPFDGPGRQPTNGNFVITEFQADIAPGGVPEPGTLITMGLGLALCCQRLRKRKA